MKVLCNVHVVDTVTSSLGSLDLICVIWRGGASDKGKGSCLFRVACFEWLGAIYAAPFSGAGKSHSTASSARPPGAKVHVPGGPQTFLWTVILPPFLAQRGSHRVPEIAGGGTAGVSARLGLIGSYLPHLAGGCRQGRGGLACFKLLGNEHCCSLL